MTKQKLYQKEDWLSPNTLCILATIFAVVFLIWGFRSKNPYLLIVGVLPAVFYEVIRTWGVYTKFASIGIFFLLILETLALKGIIKFDLAKFLDMEKFYFKGYPLPLGDIKFVAPLLIAVLSIILFFYTRGKYTKWLSVIILVMSISLVLLIDKGAFVSAVREFIKYFLNYFF